MNTGVANWNNNPNSPVSFRSNQPTNNQVRARDQENTWMGLIESWRIWSPIHRDRFDITLSARTIYNHIDVFDLDRYSVIASVMAHELGHAVGLNDGFTGSPLGGGINGSLMNHQRNRGLVQAPTPFDIESVRMIYDD